MHKHLEFGESTEERWGQKYCLNIIEKAIPNAARLYREMDLLEHIAGKKKLAHDYEEKGLKFFEQLNINDQNHRYRVIEYMKDERTW